MSCVFDYPPTYLVKRNILVKFISGFIALSFLTNNLIETKEKLLLTPFLL